MHIFLIFMDTYNFVKFRNVIIRINSVCFFPNRFFQKSIFVNKKIVVRIFTFRVDNFLQTSIIILVRRFQVKNSLKNPFK